MPKRGAAAAGGAQQDAMDDGEGEQQQQQHEQQQQQQQQDANNELEEEEEDEEEEQVEQEQYESSSSQSTTTSTLTWITWFCSLPGHEYFCEVAEDFIEDDFNLTGLNGLVPFYKEAMEMVLDVEADEEGHRVPDVSLVESSAELLYGLIHQRYIITRQGLQQMYAKFDAGHFGHCPRVYCSQTKLVPCGRSDLPGVDTVKLFCPSCVDMYVPPSSRFQGVDGAFFGTTFPHLLFQTYPSAVSLPTPGPAPAGARREPTTAQTSLAKVYVPKIYGFKVSERARSGPRMQWLRMRPRFEGELEWTDSDGQDEHDDRPEGEREHGAFDSGADEDEDDDEDVSEDEATKDGAAADGNASRSSKAAGNDKMQTSDAGAADVAAANSAGHSASDKTRPVRPLPRSSIGGAATSDVICAAVLSQPASIAAAAKLDAAKAAAALVTKPAPVARSSASLRAVDMHSKGLVTAIKTIVA
ncbi:casein kinase 2 regulatory subunit [Microbotryomycetes sp. JL201]|nr:casein kinase 2 regulatory subunit [Microbotryomycetes sp. JL201]